MTLSNLKTTLVQGLALRSVLFNVLNISGSHGSSDSEQFDFLSNQFQELNLDHSPSYFSDSIFTPGSFYDELLTPTPDSLMNPLVLMKQKQMYKNYMDNKSNSMNLKTSTVTSRANFLSPNPTASESSSDNNNNMIIITASPTYSDTYISNILQSTKIIAMIGASPDWKKPSNFAMKYLKQEGYRVIPINPIVVDEYKKNVKDIGVTDVINLGFDDRPKILGEAVMSNVVEANELLKWEAKNNGKNEVPKTIDMVEVFRKNDDFLIQAAKDSITVGAKTLWLQLGIVSENAKQIAEKNGLNVVMNRCPKIEYARLYRELGNLGIASGIISSKKPMLKPNLFLKNGQQQQSQQNQQNGSQPPPIYSGFETQQIHAGAAPDPITGSRATPIHQTTAYVFDDVDHAASLFNLQTPGNIYARLSNPTTAVLEQRIATLEGGRGATCTSSGHAAQILALFPLMSPGDKIIASDKLYGGSLTQFGKTIKKFGWEAQFVNVDNIDEVRKALNPEDLEKKRRIKAFWVESLANPGGYITDLESMAIEAHKINIPFIVDNTMASPYLCRPIEWGADLVVHSTTKFLQGHGNAMGGCVVDSGKFDWGVKYNDQNSSKNNDNESNYKFPSLGAPEPAYHGTKFAESFGDLAFTKYSHAVTLRDLGPTMAPFNAFLTIVGSETLSLRMERHVFNAKRIAEWLESSPKNNGNNVNGQNINLNNQNKRVISVSYAGLESSKYYNLSKKYTPKGAGSIFTIRINGGFDAGVRVIERFQLFSHLANIGDTRSLVSHPASTTHRQLTPEMRVKAGAGDDVLRLSIGLENVEDLIADLDYALEGVNMGGSQSKL